MATSYGSPPIVTAGLIYYIDGYNSKTIATGSTAVNDLQNTYNGTMTGNMFFADNCWNFTDGYIDNGTVNVPAFTEFTLDMWVQVTDKTTNKTFLDWGYEGTNNGILFYQHSGAPGNFRALIYNQDGTVLYGDVANSAAIVNDTWVNIGFKWSATSNQLEGLRNGEYTGTTITAAGTSVEGGSANFKIGDSSFPPMVGKIATCRIYNRVLSDAEVLQNYNALKGRFE